MNGPGAMETRQDEPSGAAVGSGVAETNGRGEEAGAVEFGETLERAIAGDDHALSRLLRAVEPALRGHIAKCISRRYRAAIEVEDVAQITYFEAFLRIGAFQDRGVDAFRGWLWQIAENNVRDAVRGVEAGRRPPPEKQICRSHPDDSYVDLLIQLGGTQTTPSKHMARKEAKRILSDAIERLPEDYGGVVRLCDLNGLSSIEAAAMLDRSPAAVRMLKARAHERLAELVGTSVTF